MAHMSLTSCAYSLVVLHTLRFVQAVVEKKSGDTYFWNPKTGAVSWERCRASPPASAPAAPPQSIASSGLSQPWSASLTHCACQTTLRCETMQAVANGHAA